MSSRASALSGSLSHHLVTQRETLVTGISLLSHGTDFNSQRYGQMLSESSVAERVRDRIHYATTHISHLSDAKCSKYKNTSMGHSPE